MADDVTRQLIRCAASAEPRPLTGKERIMTLSGIGVYSYSHAAVRRFDQCLFSRRQTYLRQHVWMRPHLRQPVAVAIEHLRVQASVRFAGNHIKWVVVGRSELLTPCGEK